MMQKRTKACTQTRLGRQIHCSEDKWMHTITDADMFGFRSKKKPKTSEQSQLCLLRCKEMAHTMCLPVTVPSKCNTCKRKYSVCFRNDACMRDNELLQSAIKGDMSSPMQSSTVNYRIDHLPLPFIGLYSMEYCNHTPH